GGLRPGPGLDSQFVAGLRGIRKRSTRVRFEMDEGITGTHWSDSEIDLIVADYFDMLALEQAGSPYNKAEHNRALQHLTGRSPGSIEFKHQNISAVLVRLGLPRIEGYKPMPNF